MGLALLQIRFGLRPAESNLEQSSKLFCKSIRDSFLSILKPHLKQQTREELRDTIENEIRAFNIDKDLGQGHVISWNFDEFEVPYNCLADEIKIGEYYLRILLECGSVSYDTLEIKNPCSFFTELYHRFLLSTKTNMKCMCLQAMTIVYTKCAEEIGPFNDTKYIVGMLEKTADRMERDRLLLFIEALIINKSNIKDVLDANGVRVLVDLVTLAHLHKNRAYVPTQTNVIEASPDMERDSEKEWYYGNKQGPCSFKEICSLYADSVIDIKTKCWAQGEFKAFVHSIEKFIALKIDNHIKHLAIRHNKARGFL